jgi:hypothetical protein
MRRIPLVPALLAALLTIVATVPAAAVQSELTIFLDFDNDPATGCNDPGSGFQGYDQRVVTTVDTTTAPNAAMVTQIEGFDCSNAQVFFDGADHPVGIGNGDLGLNVVETYWPMADFPPPVHPCQGAAHGRCLRLGVFAENANGGTDALITQDGSPTGPPIFFIFGGITDIPTLSQWGLLLLVLLLAGAAALKLRRRPLRALLTVLLVLCAGGVAFAVLGDLDGNTLEEWPPGSRVAHDPTATDDGDDIASLYARTDPPASRVYFRIDASLVFNTAPVVTTTAGATAFTEDGGPVVVDAGVTVTDADSANLASATVTITNPQDGAAEVLAAGACAGLTVGGTGTAALTITGVQPPAAYQACFQSVTYNNTSNTPGTTPRVVAFVANDGIVNSAPGNKTVTVGPTDDAPVVTNTAGSTTFTEDAGPVVVDAGVTVSDIDNANLASATVTITNPQDGAAEVLAATACAGLTVTPGLNTLGISGSQPLATYQTCLQSVTFDDTSNNPNTTNRTVSFVVNDGTLSSAPANKTVTIVPSPDSPVVITTGGSTSFTEDGGAVVVDSGVTVTDPDNANLASATVTITNVLDGAAEQLNATSCAGLTVGGGGTSTLNISGSQPLATYQTCLQSVTYNNTDQDPDATARVISFIANDGTNNSAPANKTVTVTPVNDAPVVTTTAGTTAFTEAGGPVVVDSGVTVSDVDSANLSSATVTITNPQDGAAEVLAATACGGLTVTPGLNTLAISGSLPLASYQTCLQSVTYDNTDQDPDTTTRVISFVVNDGTASSLAANKNVSVTAVDNAPVVTTTAGTTTFTEDGGAVVVDAGVTVTDVDSPNLASATVTITNVQDVGFEALAATACGALTVGGSGTPTLTISGSQPVATYQTCLQSVTYNNTDQDPSNTTRVISFVANDGTSSSAAANKNVSVAPINDPPTVTTTAGTTAFTEGDPAVVVDSGVTVSDVDNANLASATVTITNVQDVGFEALAATACGAFTVGGSGTSTLTITGSQPKATYQTCLQSVTYNNTDQDPSSTTRVISFVVNDGALNSTPATKSVSVTPVNDAPVVTTTIGSTSFTEGAGAVVVDSGVTVTDVDSPNLASATVTITNVLDAGFESLAATACGAFTVGGSGTPTLTITGSQPPATYQACLQSVTYNNTDLAPDTTNRVISFAANDGALPSNTANKTVTVTAVNSAPTVTTTAGTTAFVEDLGPVVVDSGVTVNDVDNPNLASASVTITNVQDAGLEGLAATACGAFTVGGSGTATLTITGSQPLATYQTCLQSVTYDNASNNPNTTTNRVVRFVVNDGALNSNNGDKTVSVAGTNDAPIVTPTGGNTAFTEDGGPVVVDAGITVIDVDSPNLASGSVTITNPQNGASEVLAANSPATNCPGLILTPGLNTLGITGVAAQATYQTCLRAVTYDNTSQNPTSAPDRVVRFVVNDGALASNNGDKTVTVAPVNDAPVVTPTVGTTAFTEDAGAVVVDGGITVTDVDSANLASGTVTITNPQDGAAEVLSATACGGITVTPGLNTLALSGSFPLATYQTCLQSVRYNNSSNNPTEPPNRVVRFVVNDGAANSNNGDKAVSVTAVNDAPVVTTTGGNTSFTEDGPAVVVDAGVTVSDVDNANLASATVTITNVQDVGFEGLAATACGAFTVGGSGTATLTITGSQPLATYQTCLQSVTYNNTDQDPAAAPNRVVRFVVNDGTSNSNNGDKTVTVTPVNDAPVVTTSAGVTNYTEDQPAVAIDTGLTVADVDNANLASATVTITNVQDGAAEQLGATSCGVFTVGGSGTSTLTITGSQPKATYQTCLRSVTYLNTSQNPTASPNRIVRFVVNDGALNSNNGDKAVSVTPVNDLPVCQNTVNYTTPGNTQLHVAGATTPGVAFWTDATDLSTKCSPTDPDGPAATTIVTGGPTASTNGGSFTITTAAGAFHFVPAAGFTGADTFTFQLNDGAGTNGQTANVAVGQRVWYIRDVIDANNAAGGDGRSTNAFDTIAAFNAATTFNGDIIYVFAGNTATTPHVGSITLKDAQKLWGQGVDLNVPSFGVLVAASTQARIRTTTASTDVVSVPATAGNRLGVEIRGLDLEATGATSNAVDVTSSGGNQVGVTITSNNVRGATAEGIDLNNGSTGAFTVTVGAAGAVNTITSAGNGIDARTTAAGTMTVNAANDTITTSAGNSFDLRTLAGGSALRLAISDNSVTASGTGILVDGSAAGTTTITAFSNNVVSGNTVGTGISVTSAIFDTTPGNPINQVSGGTTAVGASGNGVGAAGLALNNVVGDLSFTDLDIFNDAGAGLAVTSAGALNAAAGTGFRIAVAAGVSTIDANVGPAVTVNNASITLPLLFMESTNSPTTGLSLVNAFGGVGNTALSVGSGATGSIVDPGGASGNAVNIDGGTGNIALGIPITNNSGRAVSITNRDSVGPPDETGTISFTGAVAETGTGILLDNNDVTTMTFAGGLTASTGGNPAFAATNGGTLAVCDENPCNAGATGALVNTLTTSTGGALNVANTTISANNLEFRSISAGTPGSGPANGILLNTTGSSGGLKVKGTGAAGTGGTIRKCGTGISLTSTSNVSLDRMQLNDHSDFAIRGSSVTNFDLANTVINGVNGSDPSTNEGSVRFDQLLGAATISSSNISGSIETNVRVENSSGTLNRLVISGTTIGTNDTTTGDDGLFVQGSGTSVVNVTVQNSFFTAARGDLVQTDRIGTGTFDLIFTGNTLSNNHTNIVSGGGGTTFSTTGGTFTYNISSNTFRDANGAALAVSGGNAGVTTTGKIENNTLGVVGVNNSGSISGSDIAWVMAGGGTHTTRIHNNQAFQYNNHAILVQVGDQMGNPTNANVTVTQNTANTPGTINTDFNGIHLNHGVVATDNFTSCVDIGGAGLLKNTVVGKGTIAPNNNDIRLRQRQSTTVHLPGYGGANNDNAAVQTYLSGRNTITTVNASNTVPTGGGYVGGAACTQPP